MRVFRASLERDKSRSLSHSELLTSVRGPISVALPSGALPCTRHFSLLGFFGKHGSRPWCLCSPPSRSLSLLGGQTQTTSRGVALPAHPAQTSPESHSCPVPLSTPPCPALPARRGPSRNLSSRAMASWAGPACSPLSAPRLLASPLTSAECHP